MQVGIVVPLVSYFLLAEQYAMPLSLKEHIFMSQAIRGWANPHMLQQVANEKASETWCTSPSDYNYVGDFLGHQDFLSDYDFRFESPRCASVCSPSDTRRGCLHPPEVFKTEGQNQVLLLTSLRDTIYQPNGSSTSEAYLLPFVDYLSVAFKLSYEELDKTLLRVGHTARSPTQKIFTSDQFKMPTKFVSSCGEAINTINKEIAPGQDLILSVPELFALVCKEGYLDEIQISAGENLLSGAKYKNGALGRIVGAEITIGVFINADKNEATVRATLSPLSFVGGSTHEYVTHDGTSNFRYRQYNGLRVRFHVDGVQTVFDVNNVILNISALVVYISLPIIFIKFFAVYCLGHLSTIYYRVVYSKFNIPQECGATATRLMGSTATFHQLEDITDADGDGVHGDTGISRKVMKAYIRDVMQYRGKVLDESEMQQFVELAFNEVDNEDHTKDLPSSYFGIVKAMLIDYFDIDSTSANKSRPSQGPQCINIDEFNNAFHSAFPISFDSVVKLFDKDRSQSMLERAFTPDKLKLALSKAKLVEIMKRAHKSKSSSSIISPIGAEEEDDSPQHDDENEGLSLRRTADPHVEWR